MTVYLAVVALIIVSDCICQWASDARIRKFLLWNSLVVLAFISAFRFQVGTDYQHYIDIFNWVQEFGRDKVYVEPGYGYLNQFLITMQWGSWPLFLISSVLLSVAVGTFITEFVNSRLWCFAVFLYICGGFFFSSMNLVRQYMATAIVLWAFTLYTKRRWIAAITVFILAMSFHTAAVLYLVILPLKVIVDRKNKTLIILAIYGITIILSVVGITNIITILIENLPRFSHYAQSNFLLDRNNIAVMKTLIPNIIVLYGLYSDTLKSKTRKGDFSVTVESYKKNSTVDGLIMSGALCFAVSQILFFGVIVLTRLSELFFPFFIAYTCKILDRERGTSRVAIWFLAIVYYFILTVVTIFIFNGNGVMPYQFVPWLFS
jgi:hypothetical protein